MKENFFDKGKEEDTRVFLSLMPPQLIKGPLTLNIKPIIATILEFMLKNFDNQTKASFEEIIEGVKFLEGNQNLTVEKLKIFLDDIRNHLQTLGVINGLLILSNCAVLKADLHFVDKSDSEDDLLDFIYRDLVQDKY